MKQSLKFTKGTSILIFPITLLKPKTNMFAFWFRTGLSEPVAFSARRSFSRPLRVSSDQQKVSEVTVRTD